MSLFALFSRVGRGNRYRSISYVLRSLMSLAVGLPHPASAHWDGSLHSLSNQQAASTHLNSLSRSPWSAAPLRCCWVMSSSSRRAAYRRPSELNQVEVIRVRLLTRLPPLEEYRRCQRASLLDSLPTTAPDFPLYKAGISFIRGAFFLPFSDESNEG